MLKQALRELFHQKGFFLLFVLNLALGISGLISMESFKQAVQSSLMASAQESIGGDVVLFSRRPLTESEAASEKSLREKTTQSARLVESFSMINSKGESRLVLVRGFSASYPLRGHLRLEKTGAVDGKKSILGPEQAWVDRDLALQLGVKIGEKIRLGNIEFTIHDLITLDPTQSFRGLTISGRVLVREEDLLRTGLIRSESTATYLYLYNLAAGTKEFVAEGKKLFPDRAIRIKDATENAADSNRSLVYLTDFLSLCSLVAAFLSSLGSTFLMRTWLGSRTKIFALHQILGMSLKNAVAIPLVQILFLVLASIPLGVLIATFLLQALNLAASSIGNLSLSVAIPSAVWLLALLVAGLGSLTISLPLLIPLKNTPLGLLLGSQQQTSPTYRWQLVYWLPALLFFFSLSLYLSHSYKTASIFFATLFASFALVYFLGRVALFSLTKIPKLSYWPLNQAILHLSRKGVLSLTAFSALALSALLITLLPQLRASILAELESPAGSQLPAHFLFDVQEEQVEPLKALVEKEDTALRSLSPFIRARLLEVNNKPFGASNDSSGFRTREEEEESRFRNRGFNLTYRNNLIVGEEIVAGEPITPLPNGPSNIARLSVERRFADRTGIKLGDELLFEVQGLEIKGKVHNLRRVQWTTFQPNFFVVFEEGFLEDAPKTFLASIPRTDSVDVTALRNKMGIAFPNISVIDVRQTIDSALELAGKMEWTLTIMSILSLLAGLLVLFSITNRQARHRRWDMNLLLILGASLPQTRWQWFFEFSALSLLAGIVGTSLSVGMVFVLSRFVFEGAYAFDPASLLITVVLLWLLSLLVAFFASRSIFRSKPSELLGESSL